MSLRLQVIRSIKQITRADRWFFRKAILRPQGFGNAVCQDIKWIERGIVRWVSVSCVLTILAPLTLGDVEEDVVAPEVLPQSHVEAVEEPSTGRAALQYETPGPTPIVAIERRHTEGPRVCQCGQCVGQRTSSWQRYKRRSQEKYWGYPEYFEEAAFGALSTDLIRPQVLQGEAARLTIYDYDFIPGTAQLNARGVRRVRQMAQAAGLSGQTIVVEWLGTELDEARYQSVAAMAAVEHLNPAQVRSGQPIAAGVGGEEALIHRRTGLENTRKYGVRQFQFGAGAGGFSTSGFSTSTGSSSSSSQ